MKAKMVILLLFSLLLAGCGPFPTQEAAEATTAQTKVVAIYTPVPTSTNFPRIGTPTTVINTPTPQPTPTAPPVEPLFDDATLQKMMEGTIAATGVSAQVEIIDERASGGERIAHIMLTSEHNIDESDLLLKLFVLEVGSALRTLRAFRSGTTDAHLDATFITVNNQAGALMGTVKAQIADINAYLDGQASVNETLTKLELTGVFESFLQ